MISEQGTEKLLYMGFEILALGDLGNWGDMGDFSD